MSSINKIRKNAEKYRLEELYRNMTPEQYQAGIRKAVSLATQNLAKEYDRILEKTRLEATAKLCESIKLSIDTISVELLYELASQLGCFEENVEYLEEKKEKVQGIYEHTMQSIENYTKYKNGNKARKDFEKRKKKVEQFFDIKF